MDKVKIILEGVSPLLMNKFPMQPIEGIAKQPPEIQAEQCAYRNEDGLLYIPGINVHRALIAAGAYVKAKGNRTLAKEMAGCVFVEPETILINGGIKDYVIDSRRVVIKGASIIRHRPRIDDWTIKFYIIYDVVVISEKQMREVTECLCNRVGLLDFRPACKGSFGRSMITEWTKVK